MLKLTHIFTSCLDTLDVFLCLIHVIICDETMNVFVKLFRLCEIILSEFKLNKCVHIKHTPPFNILKKTHFLVMLLDYIH